MDVSVVIPAYNVAAFLEQCLEGVYLQTLSPERFEVILIDDGSTDDTLKVAQHFKDARNWSGLSVFHKPNGGPASARNEGIRQAKAPIIAFLDSDCVPHPLWLESLINPLLAEQHLVGVEGKTIPAPGPRTVLDHYIDNPKGGYYWTCNIAYRTEALKEIGGFDEGFPFPAGEDIDIAIRLKTKGTITFVDTAVVEHLILKRPFAKHIQAGRTFSSVIRLWRKHPGFMIPAEKPFSALLFHQYRHILLPIVRERGWLFKNPAVYFQYCFILLVVAIDTFLRLPRYYRDACEPLEIRTPLHSGDKIAAS